MDVTRVPTSKHDGELSSAVHIKVIGVGCEDGNWVTFVVQVITVELADDAEALVEFVFLTPGAFIMLLTALDGLVAIDVAQVGEGDGHLHTWLDPQQLEVYRSATFGGHYVILDLK